MALNKAHFDERNVKLLGHSVDDLQTHIDWIRVSKFLLLQSVTILKETETKIEKC